MPKIERIAEADREAIEQMGGLTVVDEVYGYSVRPGPALRRRATLVEWTAQYMAFLSIFVMIGIVASSTGLSGAAVDIFEVGIVILGVSSATGFFWYSLRGAAVEVQVDLARRELRTAYRNWRGGERLIEVHAMVNIESAFVHKRSTRARNGQFCIRTAAEPGGIALMEGDADGLSHLHEMLARAMRARRANVSKMRRFAPGFTGKVKVAS